VSYADIDAAVAAIFGLRPSRSFAMLSRTPKIV
jgi:hypothetical protein